MAIKNEPALSWRGPLARDVSMAGSKLMSAEEAVRRFVADGDVCYLGYTAVSYALCFEIVRQDHEHLEVVDGSAGPQETLVFKGRVTRIDQADGRNLVERVVWEDTGDGTFQVVSREPPRAGVTVREPPSLLKNGRVRPGRPAQAMESVPLRIRRRARHGPDASRRGIFQ